MSPATSVVPKPPVFLKMAGGKRQLLPQLLAHVPKQFNRYFEPFVGGGALFFALAGQGGISASLSDSNVRLVRTYRAVSDDVDSVIAILRTYPYERGFFETMRDVEIDERSDVEVAAWMVYLNRAGFNGLYRVNRAGKFNVPFGRYDNPTICDEPTLRAASAALRGARIWAGDFADNAAVAAKEGDLVYCDPPYVPVSSTSDFTAYTMDGFKDEDQIRLRDFAVQLKERGVHVLLSNSAAPRVRELYAGWNFEEVSARRNVNSKGDGRGKVGELLIW